MGLKKRDWIIIIVVVVMLFVIHTLYQASEIQYEKEKTVVTSVIDGDTVVIAGGQRVRLLNIDARERGEDCYDEAKQRLEEIVILKNVTLEREKENYDKYNRLLRHVYLGDQNINLLLVREGLAIVYIIPPNTKYESYFVEAEEKAMKEAGCLWKEG